MGQNSWNFYIMEDKGCIYKKKKELFKMLPLPLRTLTFAKSPGPIINRFTNCLQWYLLCSFNNTRLQSNQTGVLTSTCDLLQLIP